MPRIQGALFSAVMVGCLIVILIGLYGPVNPQRNPILNGQAQNVLEIPLNSAAQLPPATEALCAVSAGYPEEILQWCALITRYAAEHEIDPNLVAAVMLLESGGDPLAYSRSGAVGLLQVMPRDGLAAGFQCPNGPCFASRPTIQELQDPEFNLAYGIRMLAGLYGRTGSWREALLAYGPMDVGYIYADTVLAFLERYER
jgi:soluble lytic murein transglycosylase-like protein